MTYVSRRTRLFVSRWLDECDADYRLRASRKRSEGRLKRFSSADDLRAWVNDNCIKHDYFVELMSNGEVPGRPPFRLYGRFIPVPVLIQLIQNSKTLSEKQSEERHLGARLSRSATNGSFQSSICRGEEVKSPCRACQRTVSTEKSNCSLIRDQWEKDKLEKSLLQCTCLLNKAVEKLERIGDIVSWSDSAGNREIREPPSKPEFNRSYSVVSSSNYASDRFSSSISSVKKNRDSAKCAELLRKISSLREKLKKIQKCRQEVNHQIRNSRRRAECASSLQVTEIYSRQEEDNMKRLEKKLEKLVAERGRLLSEMCEALTCLNNVKKSSRSYTNFRKNPNTDPRNNKNFNKQLSRTPECGCGCKSCGDCESSTSLDSYTSINCGTNTSFDRKTAEDDLPRDSLLQCNDSNNLQSHASDKTYVKCGGRESGFERLSQRDSVKPLRGIQTVQKFSDEKKNKVKEKRKSKVEFTDSASECQKKLDAEEISDFESNLNPKQQLAISEILRKIEPARPSTSPSTQRERNLGQGIHRRVKSETSMKEIEKTLRNYEQRLSDLNDLECRVGEMKEKTSEVERLKDRLKKMKTEAQMQREAEREKSEREMTRLCSENWELKVQVEQLTAKSNEQSKKIQMLICGAMKARELECQAQELQKELSEYREGFEHQRKCISKWESVVAVQRTEIENLMNHIRMLTKMKEDSAKNLTDDRKCVQRSRSYSPDVDKGRGVGIRPKTQGGGFASGMEREEVGYCCERYPHPVNRRMTQRSFDRGYASPESRRMEWCS